MKTAYKMYNTKTKQFTHMVVTCSKKRAEELVPGTIAKYPHIIPNAATEAVMDRTNSAVFLFAYGGFAIYANNKKNNFLITRDCGLVSVCANLSEAINTAKNKLEITSL